MMLFILFIILLLTCLIMTIIMLMSNSFGDSEGFMSAAFTVGIITLISVIFAVIESRNPTAMDVYRGKTTLEITYKDGIAIDTVVVFKKRR